MAALPELRSPTIDAIEAAVVAKEVRKQDGVVRLSAIGKCERDLFYRFRWARPPEVFEARILRLFETGNIEEARMIAWLQGAGVDVLDRDPATDDQWEVSEYGGHAVGHLDGICTRIIEAPAARHLLECKTHNAKSFAQLVKHGVAISKPEHYAQMQAYMRLKGLTRAFYLAKNKDTDELHAERVAFDPEEAERLSAKAWRVITTHRAPPRLSEDPDSFLCRFCPSHGVCHGGAWAPRNCRTCLNSEVVLDAPDARWRCVARGVVLDREAQERGCPSHLFLPSLVPGEQIDADAKAGTVTYRLPGGEVWTDGLREAA
ncbi:MAG TPA: hypothetical protein VG248_03570 [Caulobacteraceae bacterium]|jgi:hypothetical protein|nr:hypothetical protein [Caulobacteraceae bacterium]